jgi:predicted Kef-type K+ transport protein
MPQLVAAGAIAGGLSVAFAAGTVTAATFITPFVTTIAAGFLGQVLTPLPAPASSPAARR